MLDLHGFLTSKERHALKRVLHRRGHSAQEHGRANAILLIDDGVPIPLIAKLLFLDEQSIRNFLQRYQLEKIAALLDNNYHGKESKLNDDQKGLLRSTTPLRRAAGYSREPTRNFLPIPVANASISMEP